MKERLAIMIAILVITVSGSAAANVEGKKWELRELNSQRVTASEAYIEINGSRITGNTGCNRIIGSYDARSNGKIDISGVASTRKACFDRDKTGTEAAFVRALGSVNRVKRTGNLLRLYRGREMVMVFRGADGGRQVGLSDRKWELRKIGGKTLNVKKNVPFIKFDSKKKSAGGNGGCNVFGGSYEVHGTNITFTDLISTMMACTDDGRSAIESKFMDALNKANGYRINGKRLSILRNQRVTLEFEAVAR